MLHELGAAIHVCPNASRVLLHWGFSPSRARLVTARTAAFMKGDTLDMIDEQVYLDMEDKFGAPFYFAHRVDLHSELKHLATGEEGTGKPATIELRRDVVGYVSLPVLDLRKTDILANVASRMPKKEPSDSLMVPS